MTSDHRVVGHSVRRKDAVAKVTGSARYAIDMNLPGLACSYVVRAQRGHARLVEIRTDEAAAQPGVLRVITAKDLAGLVPYYGHVVLDHPILATDRVLFYGEPVALVVAETSHAAAEAAELVQIDYEDLPVVTDADEALQDDAAIIHPTRRERVGDEGFDAGAPELTGNVCAVAEVGWGDIEAAFGEADLVLKGEFRYPMLYGFAMEPYNALANFEQGDLVVYSTAQHPFMVRNDLARIFGLPLSRVRVVVPYVGGGYGTKSYTKVEPLAAVAAWLTGRPVRVALNIDEAILTTRSDGAVIRARSAFNKDGRLLGRDIDLVLNSGAYTDNSPVVAQKAVNRCFGPYRIPALRARARAIFTNTIPASSLRGFGAPQGNFAGEVQMDEAAKRLGIDPVAIRLLNLVGPGEELMPGKRPLDANLPVDLELLTESLGWSGTDSARAVGFGVSASDAGAFPVSTASVRIHADGSVTAMTGATELGQGSTTVLAQIVAEELGVDYDLVSILTSDTGVTPYERTTGASRTTTIVGRALQAACGDAHRSARQLAADAFAIDVEQIKNSAGGVLVAGRFATFGEVIKRWFGADGEISGSGAIRRSGDFASMPPFWEIGASGVVATVDRQTGVVTIERLTTVADVGFAINPALVHGQDLGAATMGLGAALREELVYDGEMPANGNLVDYRVPRFSDLPIELDQILVERGDGVGPYGAKGAGEGATNPIGAAVASAVGRLIGVFPHQLPLTPERVWRLIGASDAGQVDAS